MDLYLGILCVIVGTVYARFTFPLSGFDCIFLKEYLVISMSASNISSLENACPCSLCAILNILWYLCSAYVDISSSLSSLSLHLIVYRIQAFLFGHVPLSHDKYVLSAVGSKWLLHIIYLSHVLWICNMRVWLFIDLGVHCPLHILGSHVLIYYQLLGCVEH